MTVFNIIVNGTTKSNYYGKIECYIGEYGDTARKLCRYLRSKGFKYNQRNKQYYNFYGVGGTLAAEIAEGHLRGALEISEKYFIRRMKMVELVKVPA